MLNEAFETFASGEERLQVQTKEGVVVNINTSVLLLFSPFLREVLPLDRQPSKALLILPSVSLPALLAISNLITTGSTNLDISLTELVSVASELGISGFSLEGLEDTSDTSSVSTVGNQDVNNMQEEISALSTENESLPENVSTIPADPIIQNSEADGRKRKTNWRQTGPTGQSEDGVVDQQHHDEQWVGPPAKRQAPEVPAYLHLKLSGLEPNSIFLQLTKNQYLNLQVAEINNSLLRCLVTNAKCTEQGEKSKEPNPFQNCTHFLVIYLFVQANSSGQHTICVITIQNMQGQLFSTGCQNVIHILISFDVRLTAGWPNFVNNTNSCSQCDVLFQSQDKLAFHIGAKHNEVEAILEVKGIPIPKDLALPSNLNKGPVENLETPTPLAVPGVGMNLAPVPNPGSPPGPGNAPGPENAPASAPGPGNATGPGNWSKRAAGWSCAGVNYDLQCEV